MANRRLPLGIQDFEELRKGNYLYADKTDMVWQIANGDKYNFLSRPRRFGKSLLTSTLQCYFEGKKELFEGLKIMDIEKEWVKRPVIHFSMNLGGSDAKSLSHYLDDALSKYETIYGKISTEATLCNRLTGIVERAYEQSGVQIAVLVDEYDSPLQHTYDTPQHEECRGIYRDLFTGLKDYGYCIKCVFVTGITKFTQISLFSVLNTLTNISFYNEYASICGLTTEEIKHYFMPELERLAARRSWSLEQTIAELQKKYDGYHFAENLIGVHNPFSVLSALSEGKLKSYWMSTGANAMLTKVLKDFANNVVKLDNSLIDMDNLETSDVSTQNPKLFLYQAGYLTLKGCREDSYILGFPNGEVKKALFDMVLPILLKQKPADMDNTIQELKEHMSEGEVGQAMTCLKQLIASTPYSTQKKEQFVFEEHFRFIVKNLFYICGFTVEEEKQVAGGRIDLVIHTSRIIYALELKMADNGGTNAATQQIEVRHYADAYTASHKQTIGLALVFGKDNRGLIDWSEVE